MTKAEIKVEKARLTHAFKFDLLAMLEGIEKAAVGAVSEQELLAARYDKDMADADLRLAELKLEKKRRQSQIS